MPIGTIPVVHATENHTKLADISTNGALFQRLQSNVEGYIGYISDHIGHTTIISTSTSTSVPNISMPQTPQMPQTTIASVSMSASSMASRIFSYLLPRAVTTSTSYFSGQTTKTTPTTTTLTKMVGTTAIFTTHSPPSIANLVASSAEDLSNFRDVTFDIFDDDEDLFGSPLAFDASENGLWNGRFVPPPPRPPFLVEEAVLSDGLTTCDLCSWAMPTKSTFIFEGTIEKASELGWPLTLIIVSILSALLGAIIMVAVVRCRRKKASNNRNGKCPHSIKEPSAIETHQGPEHSNPSQSELHLHYHTNEHESAQMPLHSHHTAYSPHYFDNDQRIQQQHQHHHQQQQQQQQQHNNIDYERQQQSISSYRPYASTSCSSSSLTNDTNSTNHTCLSAISSLNPDDHQQYLHQHQQQQQQKQIQSHQLHTTYNQDNEHQELHEKISKVDNSSMPNKRQHFLKVINMSTRPLPPQPDVYVQTTEHQQKDTSDKCNEQPFYHSPTPQIKRNNLPEPEQALMAIEEPII